MTMLHAKERKTPGQFHVPSPWTLVCALAMLAAMGSGCGVGSATVNPLAASTGTPQLFVDTNLKPSGELAADKTVVRTRYVTVNLSPFQAAGTPESVKQLNLNLFPDVFVTASLDRIDRPSPGGFVWVGHVPSIPNSQVALSVQDNVVVGSILIPNARYQVRFVGSGLHAIQQINQAAFPPD